MLRRPFGRTGLEVPLLGFGAMQAGGPALDYAVAREYHRRFELLRAGLDVQGTDWDGLSLRFAAHAPEVDCCLFGSTSAQHVERNLRIIAAGPLPSAETLGLRDAFVRVGSGWMPQV